MLLNANVGHPKGREEYVRALRVVIRTDLLLDPPPLLDPRYKNRKWDGRERRRKAEGMGRCIRVEIDSFQCLKCFADMQEI